MVTNDASWNLSFVHLASNGTVTEQEFGKDVEAILLCS